MVEGNQTSAASAAPAACEAARPAAPTVSVVVTVYNEDPAHLAEAVDSVLAQSVPPFEIIAVEDGALRDYAALWQRYPMVRVLRRANGGPSAARNAGLRAARGDHVLFLDGDDRLRPNALAFGLAAYRDQPDAVMAHGGYLLMDTSGRPIFQPPILPPGPDHHAALLAANCVGMHATVLYRRDRLAAIRGFDETLRGCEDWECFLRLARMGPIAYSPEILAEYRQHDGNASTDRPMMLAHLRRMLALQRPFLKGRTDWRAAARRGWRQGKRFYARQSFADLLRAIGSRKRLGGALRGFCRFLLTMPVTMLTVLGEEIWDRVRRGFLRRGPAPSARYQADFCRRHAERTKGAFWTGPADALPHDSERYDALMLELDATMAAGADALLDQACRSLRPGGVLLLVADAQDWSATALETLLVRHFDPKSIDISFYGNAQAREQDARRRPAAAMTPVDLYRLDPEHPVLRTASARRPRTPKKGERP